MKILNIRSNPDFAALHCDYTADQENLSVLQADPIESYSEPACHFMDHGKVVGNFIYINDSALLFDDVVYDVMGEFIEGAGQVFPLTIPGCGKRYLLNVLENCNPVKRSCSTLYLNDWRKTLLNNTLYFHETRVYSFSSLFKIPELDYVPILTVSDHEDYEHDFYETYRSSKLTGLVFDEIWSSEK